LNIEQKNSIKKKRKSSNSKNGLEQRKKWKNKKLYQFTKTPWIGTKKRISK